MTFKSWPLFSQDQINAVSQVLESGKVNYWTGTQCKEFEKEFASFVGSNYAVALSNGTIALELALKAVGIGDNDEVIVTARTFFASVSSILIVGGKPIFADVDLNSQNININSIKKLVTNKTKAIICVHLAGWPCDMDPIVDLARKNNLYVIEDCAQAHGAKYKGKSVGSIGDIGCWSFCQDKIMTTGGEGGMITTNHKSLWEKIWTSKEHGKNYELSTKPNNSYEFKWIHESVGSNYRMTEIQAAIGRCQLSKMPEWNKKRVINMKKIYDSVRHLKGIRVPDYSCENCNCTPGKDNSCVHGAYKCYLFVSKGINIRDKIIAEINKRGVPCFSGSCPEVYLEKVFDNSDLRPLKRLPNAKKLGETSLMFLIHPTLSEEDIKKTCEIVCQVVAENIEQK